MPENVAAPAGEAAPSENVSTNPTPEAQAPAEAPAAPAITPEQVAEFLGATPETLNQFKIFTESNGGFDKSFARFKSNIAARDANQPLPVMPFNTPPQPSEPQQPAPQPQPTPSNGTAPSAPPQVPGGFTPEEFLAKQYFSDLATRPELASIAGEIRSGEALKVLQKFNIPVMINGVFNDQQINEFFDMYAKTKPAPTPENPMTATPTVDLVQVGDTITNMNDALNVIRQDRELRAQGREGHPMAQQANEFFNNTLNQRAKVGRREHKTLDPK